ncbi:hypothetical protein N321_06653, partial [Antrostomus carolinensis]
TRIITTQCRDLWAQLHKNTEPGYRQTHRLVHKYRRHSPGLHSGCSRDTRVNLALRLVLISYLHKYVLNTFHFI